MTEPTPATDVDPNAQSSLPEDHFDTEPDGDGTPAPDADTTGDPIPEDVDDDPALQGDDSGVTA